MKLNWLGLLLLVNMIRQKIIRKWIMCMWTNACSFCSRNRSFCKWKHCLYTNIALVLNMALECIKRKRNQTLSRYQGKVPFDTCDVHDDSISMVCSWSVLWVWEVFVFVLSVLLQPFISYFILINFYLKKVYLEKRQMHIINDYIKAGCWVWNILP